MSKSWKKILVTGISLLMMASFGAGINSTNANAASRHVRRPITVYRYHPSWAFYHCITRHHIHLYRGRHINVRRFYHMGRDGFVLHVYGRSGEWYARTNSSHWFR